MQDRVAFSESETRSLRNMSLPAGSQGASPSPLSNVPLQLCATSCLHHRLNFHPFRDVWLLPHFSAGCSGFGIQGETPLESIPLV